MWLCAVQDDADAEAVAGETAAGESGDTHDSDGEAPTNPLLQPSSASHAVTGVEAREVLVRFVDRQLGLTLKPKVIKKMANPKYPTVKMLVNCWVVTGFARMPDGSMSAAEQCVAVMVCARSSPRADLWHHRSGVVMPGDIIAAVNNDSVLVRFINHTDVLKRLQDTPRPMVITFLRPDPVEVSRRMAASLRRGSYAGPAQSPPAAGAGGDAGANALSPAGSALVRRRMATSARPRAGTGSVCAHAVVRWFAHFPHAPLPRAAILWMWTTLTLWHRALLLVSSLLGRCLTRTWRAALLPLAVAAW